MYKLGLVDSIGLGVKKMFHSQVKRHFPLPEYKFDEYGTSLRLTGHVISEAVARIIHFNSDLEMKDIMALDRYQKGKILSDDDLDRLRRIRSTCVNGNELPEAFTGESTPLSGDRVVSFALSVNQRAILSVIESDPRISTDDIAIKVGISPRAVRDNIRR